MARKAVIFDGNTGELRVEVNPGGSSVTISIMDDDAVAGSIVMTKRQFEELESLHRYGENQLKLETPPVEVSTNGGEFAVPEPGQSRD